MDKCNNFKEYISQGGWRGTNIDKIQISSDRIKIGMDLLKYFKSGGVKIFFDEENNLMGLKDDETSDGYTLYSKNLISCEGFLRDFRIKRQVCSPNFDEKSKMLIFKVERY